MTAPTALRRLLRPESVAVVGASESTVASQTVASIVDRDVESFFVNPKRDTVFGRPAHRSLSDIGRSIDAVLSLLPADRTVELAEEAADLDVGGLVLVASGFAEMGDGGAELQRRLAAAADRGGMPVVGPNGVGYIDATRGIELTFLPRFERRVGGVSIVAHSGAMLEAFASCAHRSGGLGLNLLVSAGNEAVTDIADYLDYLVDDPATRIIALGLEKIRRPREFFAAALRARQAGKPVVAMKLGRTARSQAMARSHTGTITGDSWVYEVAFRQAGILRAADVDDLVDRLQFLDQVPNERWSAVRGLAVLTGTGGFASLAADLAPEEGVEVPDVERLSRWIGEVVPGATIANPLDSTGFVVQRPEIWDQVLEVYADAPEFDAFIYLSQFAEWDLRSRRFSDRFATAAARTDKPFFVSPLAGHAARWVDEYRSEHSIGVGNGLRGSLRGLQTMAAFVRGRSDAAVQDPTSAPAVDEPNDGWLESEGATILGFGTAMGLLQAAGVAVAPFELYDGRADRARPPAFRGPYVAKLADVAHRTEHGAVLVELEIDELPAAIGTLRAIAARHGLPDTVAVQRMVHGHGEVFVGLVGRSELGPLVVFGLGGIYVEAMRNVAGRLAPLSEHDARELLDELDSTGVLSGLRGGPAWERVRLEQLLVGMGRLVAGGHSWIGEMDINPLIVTDDGPVAVDAVCFRASTAARERQREGVR
jgi:acetate---CoA ligase (ADP-forming)